MNVSPSTILPQSEDDQKSLLQRYLYGSFKKVTGTALASAARTTSTNSTNINAEGARAIVVYLAVSVASGTGGLKILIRGIDPTSFSVVPLITSSTAITSTGSTVYCVGIGVGASTGVTTGALAGVPLPETIRIDVVHVDASSYTYSVGYVLIP